MSAGDPVVSTLEFEVWYPQELQIQYFRNEVDNKGEMLMEPVNLLKAKNRDELRQWLEQNHKTEKNVGLL